MTITDTVYEEAKRLFEEKNIRLSRIIENFLKFFINPWIYCFTCGERFNVNETELCPKCGWLVCPKCKACRCGLNEDIAVAVFHMRRVYEDLLGGRVK